MTRAYNTATTQQNSGGAVAGVTAGKNAVINGGMDIWQRGTSFAIPANTSTYSADRWTSYRSGATGSTVSRQSTNDTTNLPFIQYCARVQRDSTNTSTSIIYFTSPVESVNTIPFAGKTVTYSFYARAGANYSATSGVLNSSVYSGTGTDQAPYSGYTNGAAYGSTNNTLTTTWQRFSVTYTVPTNHSEMAIQFQFTPVGTASTNDYFEVTGVQLEVGSVATPFSRAGGTIQGELAACQRYYVDLGNCSFHAYSVTGVVGPRFPVTMRTTPTITLAYSGVTDRMYNIDNGTTKDLVSNYVIATTQQVSNWYTSNPASWATAKGEGWSTTVKASAEL